MSQAHVSLLIPTLVILLACAAADSEPASAQATDLSGRWTYTEGDETAELHFSQDPGGRVTGTFALLGRTAPIEGEVRGGTLVISSVGGIPTSTENGTMTGRLDGGRLMLTVVQPGAETVVLPMERQDAPPSVARTEPRSERGTDAAAAGGGPVEAEDYTGRWEAVSDDETEREVVELALEGDEVRGTAVAIERGYFSGQESVKAELALRGRLRDGALALQVSDATNPSAGAAEAIAFRRGRYLVLRTGDHESAYARPGESLVESAESSAEAAALARAITGRVYSSGSQAGGRGGFVGGRVRVAYCADGAMAYDASDVASVPGGMPGEGADMGSTRTRRGRWGIVLRGGVPVVRAEWEGTGTSYSLTEYFRVDAAPSGASAVVDGRELPATGSC